MPLNSITILHEFDFTGWEYDWHDDDGELLEKAEGVMYNENGVLKTGWNQIGDDWYYFDEDTYHRAEGVKRVPYPTEAINGKTYGPDQDAIDYAASKGETFIDANEAWFMFGNDGKFKSDYTGVSGYMMPYYENGMQVWHPGVVENGASGQYYYYVGDVTDGGNTPASDGDVYVQKVSKNNSNSINFVIGGVYTVKTGEIQKYNGITEVNGKLRYYEDAQLMRGNGLTKVDDKYIYVRSSGELVVGTSHWVPANSLNIVSGMYEFDENGYMINPVSTEKNGLVEEDGALYYYENGKRCYAGLIEIDGDMYYIRSNGQAAIGEYYVTKVNDTGIAKGTKLIFDENGKMMPIKNGIVAEAKGLFYYQNNKLMKGAGLVKIGEDMYYVRSNGQVATGEYYVTKVNDTGIAKGTKLIFGADGKMQTIKNGIMEEDGKFYYYKNNKLMKGAGVVELTDENGVTFYIYVKSNGRLATGKYWPSTRNDLLPRGEYDWGTNGILYL